MSEGIYTARFPLPFFLERGKANTVSCPVYLDGALVQPTSGTVSIRDPSGNVIVSAATTNVASIATYATVSTVFDTYGYGDSYVIDFALIISSTTHNFEQSAFLCRRKLHPVIADRDIIKRCSSLDATLAKTISKTDTYQDAIDEAWIEINSRLISQGNRPQLIMDSSALRNVHLFLTMAIIFETFGSRNRENSQEQISYYREQYENAWTNLHFDYDVNSDGIKERGKRSGPSFVWQIGI